MSGIAEEVVTEVTNASLNAADAEKPAGFGQQEKPAGFGQQEKEVRS